MKKTVAVFIAALSVFMICGSALAMDKVLFVNSYHKGYAWSDGIGMAIEKGLEGKVELKTVYMDTKRNSDEKFIKDSALKVKDIIESWKPDLVIASDDNASKYVISPYYLNTATPFVFCGVNWSGSAYGFPAKNVTGMIEVSSALPLVNYMHKMAEGIRIGFLGPDTLTSRKEAEHFKKKFNLNVQAYFSKDAEDWKTGFIELQESNDMLIIDSDGGLYEDQKKALEKFAGENTFKPTGTCYDFMGGCAVLTMSKSAEEQGAWAAGAALKILGGADPISISLVHNTHDELIANLKLARAAGITIPETVLGAASKIIH